MVSKTRAGTKLRDWRVALRIIRDQYKLLRLARIALGDLCCGGETASWLENHKIPMAVLKELEEGRRVLKDIDELTYRDPRQAQRRPRSAP